LRAGKISRRSLTSQTKFGIRALRNDENFVETKTRGRQTIDTWAGAFEISELAAPVSALPPPRARHRSSHPQISPTSALLFPLLRLFSSSHPPRARNTNPKPERQTNPTPPSPLTPPRHHDPGVLVSAAATRHARALPPGSPPRAGSPTTPDSPAPVTCPRRTIPVRSTTHSTFTDSFPLAPDPIRARLTTTPVSAMAAGAGGAAVASRLTSDAPSGVWRGFVCGDVGPGNTWGVDWRNSGYRRPYAISSVLISRCCSQFRELAGR
jgi:hypothetical protein